MPVLNFIELPERNMDEFHDLGTDGTNFRGLVASKKKESTGVATMTNFEQREEKFTISFQEHEG